MWHAKVASLRVKFFLSLLLVLLLPSLSFALTPIARVDVVPHQRIEYDTTFKFGVVAFSKEGINKVDFVISGQGYSGGTKTVTEMTLNDRTEVWEYWVPIASSEFSGNGAITVAATATSNTSGDTKSLDPLTLIVEGVSAYNHTEAWVDSVNGNDGTGVVDNSNLPFQTIPAAVIAAQTANGGSSDGNIIYLEEGVYTHGGSANTTNEWLTYTRSATALKENVIINSGLLQTNYLKIKDITIQSTGSQTAIIWDDGVNPANFWFDNGRAIGSGRWVSKSGPIHPGAPSSYSTDSYYINMDSVMAWGPFIRGAEIHTLGQDAFYNTPFVVNCTMDDLDPGSTGNHSDAYQIAAAGGHTPPDNFIIYNYKATDLHVQGIFMAFEDFPTGTGTNCAFVNVIMEMREPSIGNPGHDFTPLTIGGYNWDHLLIWNSSFPLGISSTYTSGITNTSIIGNIFWQYFDSKTSPGDPTLPYAVPGNSGNNDFLYNHFMNVYGVTGACTPTSADNYSSSPCPRYFAKAPDSYVTGSASYGGDVLDMTNPTLDNYLSPLVNSVLVNRIPFQLTPADIYGNPRIGNSDIGAIDIDFAGLPVPGNGSVRREN